MKEHRNASLTFALLTLLSCVLLHSTSALASFDDEKSIEKLFETYSKDNIINLISSKRDGKITIQKYKSFIDAFGRPNPDLITPKSVLQDLKLLHINVAEFTKDLEEQHQTGLNNKSDSNAEPAISTKSPTIPLSVQLEEKIKITKENYYKSTSTSEKRRLQKELTILRSAKRRAEKNEKSRLRVYFPETNKSKHYNSSYCQRAKDDLQELTDPVTRHQIFFCSDRKYRKENPSTCNDYRYRKKYNLKQYRDEVNRLRDRVKANCKQG